MMLYHDVMFYNVIYGVKIKRFKPYKSPIYQYNNAFLKCSDGGNTLFQSQKHFVPSAETLCFRHHNFAETFLPVSGCWKTAPDAVK